MWDDAGRLKEVKISSSTVGTYTYNAFNQRTKKVASSTTTHYVYGAGGLLYGEYDSSGNLVREYVYLNGAPLAQIDAGSPEVLTYLHTDQLGTPKYATNTSGTQVWSWAPDAFGNGSSPSGSVTINLRMPGQYYDAESGIFYNWNRYYNPEIGRYISSDPIGLAGGINTYVYVENNPLLYADELGLKRSWEECAERCGLEVLGVSDLVDVGLIASGQPIEGTKRFRTPGSSKGTSRAGMAANRIFGKAKFPVRVPTIVGGPFTGRKLAISGTKSIARFAGRAVPIVGWGLLAWDAIDFGTCMKKCLGKECDFE